MSVGRPFSIWCPLELIELLDDVAFDVKTPSARSAIAVYIIYKAFGVKPRNAKYRDVIKEQGIDIDRRIEEVVNKWLAEGKVVRL